MPTQPSSTQKNSQACSTQQAPSKPCSKRAGRAKGSKGYTAEDSTKLVKCVKSVLPLGANDWVSVLEKYNEYAIENN
ncbi:hypothetical protein PtA15_4A786 [Puccinia triticina]|nr:uncharacterized protein PtA15_4A786 [Puccinia triticina]WAQ84333.1 hypothetical protein PtA15_4A786 [Puccinia triticina]